MEPNVRTVQPLTNAQYEKSVFRERQSSLSYPEKVRQLVSLQHRIVPVCALRGQRVVPWGIDFEE